MRSTPGPLIPGILRARGGSSQATEEPLIINIVFSAHAEVVPQSIATTVSHRSILRARGGSSCWWSIRLLMAKYSPRTRR